MRLTIRAVSTLVGLAFCVTWTAPAFAVLKCAADSVKVGNVCVDKYEASVWLIPPSSTALVKKVQAGKATLADLTGGGATQLGCTFAQGYHIARPMPGHEKTDSTKTDPATTPGRASAKRTISDGRITDSTCR